MARPIKDGLDYFSLDVHIFEDEILDGISGEFGVKGELAVIKLLCAVYQKGYYIVWNNLMQAKIAKQIQGSTDLANQIVARLVQWEFFDEDLFNSAKVLTSIHIQERYLEATKRRKNQKHDLYWLNVDINNTSTVVNDDINTQSKVNKTKVNQSKQKSNDSSTSPDTNLINKTPTRAKVFENIEKEFGRPLSPIELETISKWIDEDQYDLIMINLALREAVLNQAYSLKYIDSILINWQKNHITTPAQYQEMVDKRSGKKEPHQKSTEQGPVIPMFKIGEEA